MNTNNHHGNGQESAGGMYGIKKKSSGFFDLHLEKLCTNNGHNPPMFISIPAGKGYRHVCPSCGKVQLVIPHQVIC